MSAFCLTSAQINIIVHAVCYNLDATYEAEKNLESRLLNSKRDLNTRLPRTNPVSSQGGTWTRGFRITSPVL